VGEKRGKERKNNFSKKFEFFEKNACKNHLGGYN
jgi:hypothetical protein